MDQELRPTKIIRLQGRALSLIYKRHLPIEEYKREIERTLVVPWCKEGNIDTFAVENRTKLAEHKRVQYSKVILITTAPISTRKLELLDWEGIVPEICTLKNDKEIDRELKSLEVPIERKTEGQILLDKKIEQPLIKFNELMTRSLIEPDVKVTDLTGWQVDVMEIMKKNGLPISKKIIPVLRRNTYDPKRAINVVRNQNNGTGRSAFLDALKYTNPKRFLVFKGIPSEDRFSEVVNTQLQSKEWDGDCIIFDIPRAYKNRDIYRTLDAASGLRYCRNVWMFTDWWPDVTTAYMNNDNWSLWETYSVREQDHISDLLPIDPTTVNQKPTVPPSEKTTRPRTELTDHSVEDEDLSIARELLRELLSELEEKIFEMEGREKRDEKTREQTQATHERLRRGTTFWRVD